MRSVRHLLLSVRFRAFVALLIVNLLPLVGLTYWDWDLRTLQILYWLEIGSMLFWSFVRGLFAERVYEFVMRGRVRDRFDGYNNKRGGISFVNRLPPIYPRNIPSLAMNIFMIGTFLLLFGFFVLDFGIPGWRDIVQPTTVSVLSIAFAVFITRGLAFNVYLTEQQYETCSVVPANRQLLEYVGVMVVLTWVATTETDAASTLFILLVGVKLVYELLRHRPGKLHSWDNPVARLLGLDAHFPEPDHFDSPTSDPTSETTPNLRDVSLAGIPPQSLTVSRFRTGCFSFSSYL